MRHTGVAHLACSMAVTASLATGLAGCSDGAGGAPSVAQTATVVGTFRDEAGAALPGASVRITLYDSTNEGHVLENRVLTPDATGRFQTTFTFDRPTLPVAVDLFAWPALGSGLTRGHPGQRLIKPRVGSSSAFSRYELTSRVREPSVIGLPAAPLTRDALIGHFVGASVQPYGGFDDQVDLDLTLLPGTGSDLGEFVFDYQATIVGGSGDVRGTVQRDTLSLELTEVGGPLTPSRRSTYKVIATSAAVDTLIAWPEPCSSSCIAIDSPVRLVRVP